MHIFNNSQACNYIHVFHKNEHAEMFDLFNKGDPTHVIWTQA